MHFHLNDNILKWRSIDSRNSFKIAFLSMQFLFDLLPRDISLFINSQKWETKHWIANAAPSIPTNGMLKRQSSESLLP